jgi:hypothetical protein
MFRLPFCSGHSSLKHLPVAHDGGLPDRLVSTSSFPSKPAISPPVSGDWLGSGLYATTITRLYRAREKRGTLFHEDSSGICCFDVHLERRKIAALLVQALRKCIYCPGTPHEKLVKIGTKVRRICRYPMLDTILQSALYRCLSVQAGTHLSKNVYGYLPGRSAKRAIDALRNYLNGTSHRDVYILRMDVKSYSDSIPSGSDSLIWRYLDRLIDALPHSHLHEYLHFLVRHALRPILVADSGAPYQRIVGIPTGSPLNNLACFIYLQELDFALERIPGGLYVRYGDDIVFAHPDASCFYGGVRYVDEILARLSLKRNVDKEQIYFLSRPGCSPVPDDPAESLTTSPGIRGAEKINYLGHVVRAGGRVSTNTRQVNEFTGRLLRRAEDAVNLVKGLEADARGRALCNALNRALTPDDPLADRNLKRLLDSTSDRDILKQIDYRIALKVAELISGGRGVRAWRKISYKTIRTRWELVSLCHLKNRSMAGNRNHQIKPPLQLRWPNVRDTQTP